MRVRPRVDLGQWNAVSIATVVLLAFSFLFGGASRQHELRLALVELAAVPLLVLAFLSLFRSGSVQDHRLAFGIGLTVAALPLVQLVPLPPQIWTALPGRDELNLALSIVGAPVEWVPMSLTPDRTWRSFLALLPPLAMFIGVLASPPALRVRLVQIILAFTLLSIALGAAQIASGGDRLYFWATTDAGNFVGMFANRNHMATLCLISLPFAAVFAARGLRKPGAQNQLWIWASLIGLVIIVLGVVRSRAGIILVGPVMGASLLAAWVASGKGRPKPLLLGIVASSAIAVAVLCIFTLAPILQRFDTTGAREGRFENWPIVAEAANTYLPLGSGFGSFDAVFRSVEPLERLDATFFNQAHNEYLETWLEAGWSGIALVIAFLVWFGRRTWTAWRGSPNTQRDLQRAASIAIGVVLLHSVGDYPLRTETLAVIFALCCALLELASGPDLAPVRTRRRSRD